MVRQSRRDRGGNSRKHHQATKEVDAAIRQVLSNLSSEVVSKMVAQEAEMEGGMAVDVRTSGGVAHGTYFKYRCSTGAEMFTSLVQLLCNNITLLPDATAPSPPRRGGGGAAGGGNHNNTLQSNNNNNTLTSPQVITLVEFLYSYLSWLLPPVPAFPSSLPTTTSPSTMGAGGGGGVGAMVNAAAQVVSEGVGLNGGGDHNNNTSSSAVVVLSSATTSRYACPRIPQFACDFIYRNRVIENTNNEDVVIPPTTTSSDNGGGSGVTSSSSAAVASGKTPPLPELPAQPTSAVMEELERLPLTCAKAVSRALGDGWERINATDSQFSTSSHIAPLDKVFTMQAMMYLLCYRLVGMYPRWVLLSPGSTAALAAECVTILHTEALFTQQRSEGIEKQRRSMRSRGGIKNRKWKEKRQQQLSSLAVCPKGTKQAGNLKLLADKRSKKREAISLGAILAACKQPSKGAADTLFLLTGLQVIVVEVMCLLPPTTQCNPNNTTPDGDGDAEVEEEEVAEEPSSSATDQRLPIDRNYIPPSPSVSDSAERESSCDGSDQDEDEVSCACVGGFLLSWILSSAETRAVMMTGRNEVRLSSGGVVMGGGAAISPSAIPRQQQPTINNSSSPSSPSSPFQQQHSQDSSSGGGGGGINMKVSIVADLLFTFRGTSTPAEVLWDTPSFATDKYEAVAHTVLDACLPDNTPTGNPAKAVTSTSFLRWLRNIPKSAKRPVEVLPRVMTLLGSWEAGVNNNNITTSALVVKRVRGSEDAVVVEEDEWSLLERLPSMLSSTSTEWLELWLPIFLRRWRAVDMTPTTPDATVTLTEPRGSGGSRDPNQVAQKEHQRRNVSTLEERLRVIIQCCSTVVHFYLPSTTTTATPQRIHTFMVGVHAVCATVLEAVNSAFDRAIEGHSRSQHNRRSTPQHNHQHHHVHDTGIPELPTVIKALLVLVRPLSMGVVPITTTTPPNTITPSVVALYTSHMTLIKGVLLPTATYHPVSTIPTPTASTSEYIAVTRAITTQLMGYVRAVIDGPSTPSQLPTGTTSLLHTSEQKALVEALPGLLYHLTAVVGDASNRPAGTISPLNQSWFLELVDFLLTILTVKKYSEVVEGGSLPASIDLGVDALRSWGGASGMEAGAVMYHSIGPLITSQLLPLLRQLQVHDDTVPHLIATSFFAAVRMYHHSDVPRHISAPVMTWLRTAVLEYNIIHSALHHLSVEIQSLTGSSGPSVAALEMGGMVVEAVALLCATSEGDVEANRGDACTFAMRVSNDLWQLCHLLLDQDFTSAAITTTTATVSDTQSNDGNNASPSDVLPQTPLSTPSGVVVGYFSRRGALCTPSPLCGIHGFLSFQRRLNTVHNLLNTLMTSAAFYPPLTASSLPQPSSDCVATNTVNSNNTNNNTPQQQELILLQLLGFVSHHVHVARSTSRVRSLKGTMPTLLSQRYELCMLRLLGEGMASYGTLPLIDSLRIATTTSYTPAQTAACRRYTETVVKTLLVLIKYYWVSAAPSPEGGPSDVTTKEEMESMKHLNIVTGNGEELYRVTEVDLACVTCLRGVLARVPFSNIQLPFIPEAASRIIGLLLPPASRLRVNAAARELGGSLVAELVGLAHDTFEHCMAVASEARARRIQHRKTTPQTCGGVGGATHTAESDDAPIVTDNITPADLDNDDVIGLLSRTFIAYALPALRGIVLWEAKTVSSRFIIQDEPSPAGLLGSLKVLTTIFAFVDEVGTSNLIVPPPHKTTSSPSNISGGLLSDLNILIKSFMGQPLGAKRPREGEDADSSDPSFIASPVLPTMTVSGGPPSCIQAALQSSRAALMGLTRCICASKGFDGETILLDAGGSHSERSAPSTSSSSSSSDNESSDDEAHDSCKKVEALDALTTSDQLCDVNTKEVKDATTTTTTTCSTSSPSTMDEIVEGAVPQPRRVRGNVNDKLRRRVRRKERDMSMYSLYEAVLHISGLDASYTENGEVTTASAITTAPSSPICALRDTVLILIHATALAISTGTMSALDGVTTIGDAYQTLVACLDCATAARRWLDVMGPTLQHHIRGGTTPMIPHNNNSSHLAPRLYLLPLVLNVRDVLVADLPQWKTDLQQQGGITAVPASLVQAVEWVRAFLDQYSLARVVTGISAPQPPEVLPTPPSPIPIVAAAAPYCALDDDLAMLSGGGIPRPPQAPSTPTPPQPQRPQVPATTTYQQPPPTSTSYDREYNNLTLLQETLVQKLAVLMGATPEC